MPKKLKYLISLVCIIINLQVKASIFPSNGIRLNYTQIMFEYNEIVGAEAYTIHIFPQTIYGDNDTSKEIIINNNSLAIIVNELSFGQTYKWYYEAFNQNKKINKSDEYFFGINNCSFTNKELFKFSATTPNTTAFENDVIFLDQLGIAINRQGKPIWFLPQTTNTTYRNIAMSSNGTITMLQNNDCYEKDLLGNIIWHAPNDGKISGDSTEHYHHDFMKLRNGHFLTSSYIFIIEKNKQDTTQLINTRYNTLIEYDMNGNVVWSWNEKNFIDTKTIQSAYNKEQKENAGTHLNSFFINEKFNQILISCRNNSRIAMIDKITGKYVFELVGKHDTLLPKNTVNIDFSKQHAASIITNRNILFYNNNVDCKDTLGKIINPHVVILSVPKKNKPSKVIWDYECSSNAFPKGISGKEGFARELPNGNIFVCMGGANRSFEVTKNKEIVWECFFEKFESTTNSWQPINNYRTTTASSLYPQYFTVNTHLAVDSIDIKNNVPTLFTINNDGTEDDTYTINMIDEYKQTILFTTTSSIKNKTSFPLKILLPKGLKPFQKVSLEVYPINNKVYSFNKTFVIKN